MNSAVASESTKGQEGTGEESGDQCVFDSTELKGQIQDDDEAEEREKMWFPRNAERLWQPVAEQDSESCFDTLTVNSNLTTEQRNQLLDVCRSWVTRFPARTTG